MYILEQVQQETTTDTHGAQSVWERMVGTSTYELRNLKAKGLQKLTEFQISTRLKNTNINYVFIYAYIYEVYIQKQGTEKAEFSQLIYSNKSIWR